MEIDMQTPGALMGLAFGIPASAGDEVGQENGHRWDPMDCDQKALPPARTALRMECDFSYLPDHDEDAHFCHARAGVVGVADGVGGCRGDGVDAGEFSRGLMANAYNAVAAASSSGVCPYTLLEMAYQKPVASTRTPAASTALVLSLAGRALRWAYVGDSTFAVFRGGRLLLRALPQQHYFNCPFQLSAVGGDRVQDAALGEFPVEEGDVVVAGTDGLFDNVFDAALEGIVQRCTALSLTPGKMAQAIGRLAYDMAMSSRESPFSAASREKQGTNFTGGKMDDITVIVAFIVS
jgi:protein phosphatase PTC7